MAVAQKAMILQDAWTDLDAKFFSGNLGAREISALKSVIALGHYQLWKVYEGDKHVASVATRLEKLWSDKIYLSLCHVGGNFTKHLDALDDIFKKTAKANGCAGILVYCGRYELALRLIDKHDCKLKETIVLWEVPE